jgi:hypothetical protein
VPGEAFCDYCGSPLEAPVPVAIDVAEIEDVVTAEEPEELPAPPATDQTPEVEEDAEAEGGAISNCPACGAEVAPDEAFCASCGASLAQAPIPPEPVAEAAAEPATEKPPEPEPELAEAEAPEPEELPEPDTDEEVEASPAEEAVTLEEVTVSEDAPAPEAAPVCPACGAELEAGDAFCSDCGYALEAPPAAEPVVPPAAVAMAAGPRLLVVATGAEIPLAAQEEILIGREDPVSGVFPDVDLTPHGGEDGGVSRRHARLIIEGDDYFVEDLDSTNFTFVNRQKLVSKARQPVNDGDEIRCGRVALVLKTS